MRMEWILGGQFRLLVSVMAILNMGSAPASGAGGVIYFNQVTSVSTPVSLRRVQADGTGNTLIPVALPSPTHPVASRDGTRLLLTSNNPDRPFMLSRNVFSLSLVNGQMNQVTGYEDLFQVNHSFITNSVGNASTNRFVTSYTLHYPDHKAMSGDNSAVVVMDLPRTGGSTLDMANNVPNGLPSGGQTFGSGRAPGIEVFPSIGPTIIGNTIFLSAQVRDGLNQGGDGVDWHPALNEVVATVGSDVPMTGNTGRPGMQGTLLAVFSTINQQTFIRKLTNPIGESNFYVDLFNILAVSTSPHDYAPAISPDGTTVAYVRHSLRTDTRFDGAGIAPLPCICAIHIINYNGTNDREILRMSEGMWISRLSWSPDGQQIAFDLAPQMVLNGWNSLVGDPTRSTIHVTNVDGSNARQLIPAPAAYPSWAPEVVLQITPPRPSLLIKPKSGNNQVMELEVNNLLPGRSFEIQKSTDFSHWNRYQLFTATHVTMLVEISILPSETYSIYRVLAY